MNFLILAGDGLNCENETKFCLEKQGGIGTILPISELIASKKKLLDFDGLILPGGFSFGDDLGSGKVLALKLEHELGEQLKSFIASQKPILGICNGFQVLVHLGLIPGSDIAIGLAPNKDGHFIDQWANLELVPGTVCKWTTALNNEDRILYSLPLRHGEGRVVLKKPDRKEQFENLLLKGQVVFTYEEDLNGSYKKIAGLCDPSGLILGLMPHPELDPKGMLFKGIMEYFQ